MNKKSMLVLLAVLVIVVFIGYEAYFKNTKDSEMPSVSVNDTNTNNDVPSVNEEQNVPPVEAEKDFEGEADPSRMKLDMTTWNWIKTTYSDGKVVTPKTPDRFKLTFKNDKTFSASTDCNGVGGGYSVKDGQITFDKMMSTMMYCEGSQEAEFGKMLTETQSYFFTSRGELVLGLKFDSGSVIFR